MIWSRKSSKLLIRTIDRSNLIQKDLFNQNTSNEFESLFNVVNFSRKPYLLKDATLNSYSNKKYSSFAQFRKIISKKRKTKEQGTNTSSRTHIKNNSSNYKTLAQKKILLNNSLLNEKIKEKDLCKKGEDNYNISPIRKKKKYNNIFEVKKSKINNIHHNIKSFNNSMNHLFNNNNIKNKRNKTISINVFKTIDFPHNKLNLDNNEEASFPKITQNKIFQKLDQKIAHNIKQKSNYFKSIRTDKSQNYVYNIKLQNKKVYKIENVFNNINNSERINKAIDKIFTKKKYKTMTNTNFKSGKNNKIDNCYICNLD